MGWYVRQQRIARAWSMGDQARKLGAKWMPYDVSRWEANVRALRVDAIDALARSWVSTPPVDPARHPTAPYDTHVARLVELTRATHPDVYRERAA